MRNSPATVVTENNGSSDFEPLTVALYLLVPESNKYQCQIKSLGCPNYSNFVVCIVLITENAIMIWAN